MADDTSIDKLYLLIQSTLLFGGSLYAWSSVYHDFLNYFGNASNRDIPLACLRGETVLSACFAGAGIFLLMFVVSLAIYQSKRSGGFAHVSQEFVTWVLGLVGLVAWGVTELHAVGVMAWTNTDGCMIQGMHAPAEDPSYYLAMLFTAAFLWALVLVFREHRGQGRL